MSVFSQNNADALAGVKALTCDTGGTFLDWHSGFREAFSEAGDRHGINRNWADITNDLRRRSMKAMLNLGKTGAPDYNFDEAHRFSLDPLLQDEGLEQFDAADRCAIPGKQGRSVTKVLVWFLFEFMRQQLGGANWRRGECGLQLLADVSLRRLELVPEQSGRSSHRQVVPLQSR